MSDTRSVLTGSLSFWVAGLIAGLIGGRFGANAAFDAIRWPLAYPFLEDWDKGVGATGALMLFAFVVFMVQLDRAPLRNALDDLAEVKAPTLIPAGALAQHQDDLHGVMKLVLEGLSAADHAWPFPVAPQRIALNEEQMHLFSALRAHTSSDPFWSLFDGWDRILNEYTEPTSSLTEKMKAVLALNPSQPQKMTRLLQTFVGQRTDGKNVQFSGQRARNNDWYTVEAFNQTFQLVLTLARQGVPGSAEQAAIKDAIDRGFREIDAWEEIDALVALDKSTRDQITPLRNAGARLSLQSWYSGDCDLCAAQSLQMDPA